MFSKACEYGIQTALIAAQFSPKGKKVQVGEIANKIDSPVASTAKFLQQLARAELISSVKALFGGYFMSEISIRDIIIAIDGDKLFRNCDLGLKACNAHKPCPLHF